jgi:hypothetical protein
VWRAPPIPHGPFENIRTDAGIDGLTTFRVFNRNRQATEEAGRASGGRSHRR